MDNVAKNQPALQNDRPAGFGADLRVVFCCPDCDVRGWVHWNQLPLGMKCGSCNGEFWIGADGKLHSARRAEKIRFACPRCGSKQQLPVELSGRRATCPACGLKCRKTAGGEFQAVTRQRARRPLLAVVRRRKTLACIRVARPRVLLSLLAAAILGAIALAYSRSESPHSESLEQRAGAFTSLCFQGRMDLAAEYVVAQQTGKLKAWAALVGAVTPGSSAGSARVRVHAAVHDEGSSQASVRIEVQKGAQNKSAHTQRWIRSNEGIWRFDPQATLRSIVPADNYASQ
jgi:hypothetical protein